jgi:ELWxxDGT repeat protein
LRNADGRLFFTADDGTGAPAFFNPQVWASDGTAAGTRRVATPFPDGGPSRLDGPVNLTPVGDRVFFTPANDPQLWVTDGQPGGTRMLRDFASADGFVGPPSNLTAVGGRLYFTVESPADGLQQLWQSDGTPGGTVLVAEHVIVEFGSGVAFRGALYFVAADPVTFESRVWRSDGTPAGTHLADPDHPGASARHLTVVGDRLYYFDADATTGLTVWRTDGRHAVLVSDVHPDGGFWFEYNPVAVGGRLMFAAVDGETGAGELWTSGGNARNTRPVAAGRPDFGNTAVAGDRLFFTVTTDAGDRQLWVSGGAAASTRAVAPISAPTDIFGDPLPIDLTAFGGKVYFTATDPAHGQELWESDGTAAGTRVAADLFPGPASSAPAELTVVGDRLYVAATDRLHGRELWALRQSGLGRPGASLARVPARLVSGLTGWLDEGTHRTVPPDRGGTAARDPLRPSQWLPGRPPPIRTAKAEPAEPPGTGPTASAPGPDDGSTLGI